MTTPILAALLVLQAPTYTPSTTNVAVLLGPSTSRDKWTELKEKEREHARDIASGLFSDTGFKVVDSSAVDQAVKDSAVDFSDEEQWTRANLIAIGRKCGANLVYMSVVRNCRVKTINNFLLPRSAGEAQLESWLVDVDKDVSIIDGVAKKGERKAPPPGATGMRLDAVKRAVQSTLKDFLAPYAPKKEGS